MTFNELYKILDDYACELVYNEALNNQPELRYLFSKDDYIKMLMPVISFVNKYPNDSFESIKNKLIKYSGIDDSIKNFIDDKKMTPGIVIDYGTDLTRDSIVYGNSKEYPYKKCMTYDTIFDLASTSKLFTTLSILMLKDAGMIKLDDGITKYNKKFYNLDGVSVNDLLKFKTNILTKGLIYNASNYKEADDILHTAYVNPNQNMFNPYSDLGAMVLMNVVEEVTGMSFSDFINECIISPVGMEDTYVKVPFEKIYRVANENYSAILNEDGSLTRNNTNFPGTPHDRKAVAYGHAIGRAPGHAGIFSTTGDMLRLADSVSNCDIISKDSLMSISDNEVGKTEANGNSTKYYGSLVYAKQTLPGLLGVYDPLSGKAWMSPGFAGTELVIDPVNRISLFFASNRLHNRIYQVHPSMKDSYVMNGNAKMYHDKYFAPTFTLDKESIVHTALDLALQFKLLEKIYGKSKKNCLVKTK